MAKINLSFTTNAPITAKEIANLHNQISMVQAKLGEVNRVSVRATNTQQGFTNAIKQGWKSWLVYSVAVYGAIKAVGQLKEYIGDSVNKFREFQTRIAEVSTILDRDMQDSIYGLQQGVVALSLEFGKNTSDMAKGLYDILSAAFDARQAIALLGTASKAAIAGLADIRESVDIFTTVLNSYGMSAYEATKVSDQLFQSVVRGKFQFRDLESALGYVVPIAAQAGISFQELMAALSTTTRHGLHLDMASRGLALAIQNIINPSEGARKAAEKYGIALDGITLRVKGLKGFFKDLNEKTKEFGNSILADIIPNMRSLRVAMVLAGEEGLKGMMDDFELLSVAAGRTEEALKKIQDTSGFVSNKIQQQWEKTQREIGEQWDKLALGAQSALVKMVQGATDAIGWITNPIYMFNQKQLEKSLRGYVATVRRESRVIQGELYGTTAISGYLNVMEQIKNLSEDTMRVYEQGGDVTPFKNALIALQQIATDLKDDFDKAFGEPILGGIRRIEELQQTMVEIESDIRRLKDELEKPMQVGWGSYQKTIRGSLNVQLLQLKATQKRVDYEHDVQMALKMSNYEWKTHNEKLIEAVNYVKDYDRAQKELQSTLKKTNDEMRKLELEALKIQLKGMLRRRGLTRSEEIKLKKIQIEQTKLRISQMEEQVKAATQVDSEEYDKRKQFIDDFLNKIREEEYQAKYTYDQQIIDLQEHIKSERKLLNERYQEWEQTHNDILSLANDLVTNLDKLFPDDFIKKKFEDLLGIDIDELIDLVKSAKTTETTRAIPSLPEPVRHATRTIMSNPTIPEPIKRSLSSHLPFFQHGTNYVPETGLAVVHKGEQIIPAGGESGKTEVNIRVNVNATMGNVSPDEVADKIATAIQQRLVDVRTGKTRFRVR